VRCTIEIDGSASGANSISVVVSIAVREHFGLQVRRLDFIEIKGIFAFFGSGFSHYPK
jgi:hypothetical protein